jgi:aspartyl aminopeptidase
MSKKGQLAYSRKNVWEKISELEKKSVLSMGEDYKQFIKQAKTERETIYLIKEFAENNGFKPLQGISGPLKPGDRVYAALRNKSMVMAVMGSRPLVEGANIIGAHVDSPRLDLKVHPLYEKSDLALLETHYYGGIKKYHWLALPLALHGVVFRKDGIQVNICIGEEEGDPVFTVTDLLPHLAREQAEKKVLEAFPGESLDVLCGSLAVNDREVKERVKETILDHLHEKYGIIEEDLVSAELELVPAVAPRDIGFDRSMIGAYGQDDRVCAYAQMMAINGVNLPNRTAVGIFTDKEEIGSVGNTGMQASFFADIMAELLEKSTGKYNELLLRRAMNASRALSADVNAALDPNFEEVMEKNNAARLGCGVVITKYTGSGGKKGANDAHAEYMALVRKIFNDHNVIWQTGELGKVDQGGGGTIAYMLAEYGMDVVDCGVALLGMHSPFEVSHKADIYMMHQGYRAFFLS